MVLQWQWDEETWTVNWRQMSQRAVFRLRGARLEKLLHRAHHDGDGDGDGDGDQQRRGLSLFWQDCQSRRSEMWRRPLFVSILHFSTASPSSAPASTASSSPSWSSPSCQSRRSENRCRSLCWSDFVSTLQFSNSIEIETEQQLCLQIFSSLTIENVTHKPPTNIISDWFGHLMLKCHKQNPKRFMQKWHPPQAESKKVVTRNLKYDLSLYCW